MINELIEKEIEKFRKEGEVVSFDWSNAGGDWDLEALFEESLQTIVKEVAMRFKYNKLQALPEDSVKSKEWQKGYNWSTFKTNELADQIINEVSN